MAVAKNLNFDMAWLSYEFLNKNTVIAKRVSCLVLGRLEPLAGLRIIPRNAHALTATTGRGLDHHRITNLIGNFDRVIRILDQTHVTGDRRNTSVLGNLLRGNLVPHLLNRANWGANKGNALSGQGLCEFCIFGQETISGVNSLSSRGFDRLHHLIDNDIRLVGWGRANVDCFIRHLHMQSLLIGIRIDGDSANAHFAGSFDNTTGDLATVGDQDFVEHVMSF